MLALASSRELSIREEPWSSVWPDAKLLALLHAREVEAGVEPRRWHAVDEIIMERMAELGVLRTWVARGAQGLVGYLVWQVTLDAEAKGLLIAQMGPWYVLPHQPRVAFELFDASIAGLKALGVQLVLPHHRTQGRGAGLGKFFQRRGAKLIQHTYSLWIGEEQEADG